MTWDDKRFIEEYLCNRTSMYSQFQNYFDSVGSVPYTERYRFIFKCELLEIVDEKIRLHYWVPVNDESYKAKFSNISGDSNDPKVSEIPRNDVNLRNIFFRRNSAFLS